VHIESEVGRGTTVILNLPRTDRAPETVQPPDRAHHAPHKACGSILLVEDDDEVAGLVTDMLRELGYEVTRAAAAEAALGALADARPIDALFSDIMMPGRMNGVDLAHEAQRRRPGLPVLLTSGYADAAIREAGREGIRVLRKPYDIDTLAETLGEVLERRGEPHPDA
jgi:DNA-binding NtrC family response regulator